MLFLSGGTRHGIGLVLKPMAEEFSWAREDIGAAVGIFFFVSAICLFFAGLLADRYPPRTILCVGIILSTFGIGNLGFVSEPWQVILSYGLLFGIGAGLVSPPPVNVMFTRLYPKKTGLANAFAIAGMGLGQLIIISGFSFVLIELGWRFVFIWLSIANLILLPFVLWSLNKEGAVKSPQLSETARILSFTDALKTPYLRLLISVYAICGFQDFFVSTHLVAFAQDQGLGTLLSGNILAFMGLAGLLGVLVAGVWCDRSGPIPPTLFCFLMRTVIFTLICLSKNQTLIVGFSILYGITFWITAPLTFAFVRDAFGPRNTGAISGFVMMVHHFFWGESGPGLVLVFLMLKVNMILFFWLWLECP